MEGYSILPIILCGGSGTRLWPLSRDVFPKQFISLFSEEGKSLLQQTYERLFGLKNLIDPILICNDAHRFLVAEQMRELNLKTSSILLEPQQKNSAPAITLASLKSLEIDPNANLLILSSDHHIKNEKKLRKIISYGIKYSEKGEIVTFGVVPTYPETGYGYIKSIKPLSNSENECQKIDKFIDDKSPLFLN